MENMHILYKKYIPIELDAMCDKIEGTGVYESDFNSKGVLLKFMRSSHETKAIIKTVDGLCLEIALDRLKFV